MDEFKYPVKRLKPCVECPYLKTSLPGYTGGNPSEWYVDSATADYTIYGLAPCHLSVKEGSDPLGSCACAGALIFARNIAKRPRDPARAAAVGRVEADRERVFTDGPSLIEHHRGPFSMRSWE